MNPRLFSFVGGAKGPWQVTSTRTIVGEPLTPVERIAVVSGDQALPSHAKWILRGVTSNERYTTHAEKRQLSERQASLGRTEARHAALIPLRKNAAWWALSQDDRRSLFEEHSKHIAIGLKYLPAIARRLHHCRDLAEQEPFDFLTFFDFADVDSVAFDELLAELRKGAEWEFVDREVEIRMIRD